MHSEYLWCVDRTHFINVIAYHPNTKSSWVLRRWLSQSPQIFMIGACVFNLRSKVKPGLSDLWMHPLINISVHQTTIEIIRYTTAIVNFWNHISYCRIWNLLADWSLARVKSIKIRLQELHRCIEIVGTKLVLDTPAEWTIFFTFNDCWMNECNRIY